MSWEWANGSNPDYRVEIDDVEVTPEPEIVSEAMADAFTLDGDPELIPTYPSVLWRDLLPPTITPQVTADELLLEQVLDLAFDTSLPKRLSSMETRMAGFTKELDHLRIGLLVFGGLGLLGLGIVVGMLIMRV